MDPQSDDYQFGRLTTEVGHLTSAVKVLTLQVTALRVELEELKMFRSKVMGISVAASLLASMVLSLGMAFAKAWTGG